MHALAAHIQNAFAPSHLGSDEPLPPLHCHAVVDCLAHPFRNGFSSLKHGCCCTAVLLSDCIRTIVAPANNLFPTGWCLPWRHPAVEGLHEQHDQYWCCAVQAVLLLCQPCSNSNSRCCSAIYITCTAGCCTVRSHIICCKPPLGCGST